MRSVFRSFSVFLALTFIPVSANALVFTNEAAFQTAAGGVVIEDFESYSLFDPVAALSGLHLSFSLPDSNGSTVPQAYDQSSGGVARSGQITLMNNDKLNLPALGRMQIDADAGTEFLAFGYWNVGGDDTTRLTLYDVNDVVIETAVTSEDDPAFIGIIGAVGATRAVIEAVQGNGWFTIDDIQVDAASVAAAIPAPGAMMLFLLGLAYMRSRRQALS